MHPRFVEHYSRELQFIREMGGEFAREYPKIAARLGMEGFEVADPYVERLLEGFAFLSARVQLKLADEFPRFTENLMEMVYPHYLCPTPSMAIVELRPNLRESSLTNGFVVARNTPLRSLIGPDEQTACEFRTAQDVTLWPLEIARFDYRPTLQELGPLRLGAIDAQAAARMVLRAKNGLSFDALSLDRLTFFLRGDMNLAARMHEQIHAHLVAVLARPAGGQGGDWQVVSRDRSVLAVGFEDAEAILPYGPRSFHGYRLLREYAVLPQRFLFSEIRGLGPAVKRCRGDQLEIAFLFDGRQPSLEGAMDASHVALSCTPAVNLFPRRADRIALTDTQHEHHVVPDRTRPMDFEVYGVTDVVGHGPERRQKFFPFYGSDVLHTAGDAWYTLHREQRRLSRRQEEVGPRSATYVGSETFLTLVDGDEGPFRSDLRELAVETLCTNRDLPLHIPLRQGSTDFHPDTGAPIESVRCLIGPTPPRPSYAHGDVTWRLISHLALNYVSLVDGPDRKGAPAIRELLSLYFETSDPAHRREIDGILSVASQPIVRNYPTAHSNAFVQGTEVTIGCDDSAFAGSSPFLLASVLEQFFANQISINSFTETVLRNGKNVEIMRWPPRIGRMPAL
ncbi:MAG TPA: type VI secretion system baseplate subunit TssF [Polyangiaceae bacterium]